MSAGKGDTPRAVNGEVFRRNYDEIFRKQDRELTWDEAKELMKTDPSSLVTAAEPTFNAATYLPSPL